MATIDILSEFNNAYCLYLLLCKAFGILSLEGRMI